MAISERPCKGAQLPRSCSRDGSATQQQPERSLHALQPEFSLIRASMSWEQVACKGRAGDALSALQWQLPSLRGRLG
eukprot:2540432-Amphidinium_carterae.2